MHIRLGSQRHQEGQFIHMFGDVWKHAADPPARLPMLLEFEGTFHDSARLAGDCGLNAEIDLLAMSLA